VIVLRATAVTSVEVQIGQTLQTAAGMIGRPHHVTHLLWRLAGLMHGPSLGDEFRHALACVVGPLR
jgi:hypothetical protein